MPTESRVRSTHKVEIDLPARRLCPRPLPVRLRARRPDFFIRRQLFRRPFEGVIVELIDDDRLDHGEIWRDVEISRRIKTRACEYAPSHFERRALSRNRRRRHFPAESDSGLTRTLRRSESSRSPGSDRRCRSPTIAAARTPEPADREKIARKIEDLLVVILHADPAQRVVDDCLALLVRQADGPANSCIKLLIFGKRRKNDANFTITLPAIHPVRHWPSLPGRRRRHRAPRGTMLIASGIL